jgi:hypothetical protein
MCYQKSYYHSSSEFHDDKGSEIPPTFLLVHTKQQSRASKVEATQHHYTTAFPLGVVSSLIKSTNWPSIVLVAT